MRNLQTLMYDWGVRCFGLAHMQDRGVRALRMVEEAIEAAQAYGVPKTKMLNLVDIVYGRLRGTPIQELGGVLVTTSVLCEIEGTTLEEVFLVEVRRCLSKQPEHFAKRNQEKLDLGLIGQVERGEMSPNDARKLANKTDMSAPAWSSASGD